MNLQRIGVMMSKEWREIRRDRLYVSLAFVLPVVLMVLFGYGLSFDVENVPFALVDHDRSALSRDYAYRFISSRYFDFRGYVAAEKDLDALLADNVIRAAIVIPEQFEQRILHGESAAVLTLIDGVFPERALTTKGYVDAINAAVNREMMLAHIGRRLGIAPERTAGLVEPVRLEVRYLYNEAVRSIWSLAPRILCVTLLITPPFLTSLGVVREKESGSIYNIYVSTLTRAEFLVGKLTPYVLIAFVNVLVLSVIATRLFGAPFKGELAFFIPVSLLYVMCTTGIGLLVSLMVQTQMAAIVATVILTIVPAVNYSGLLIPITSLDPQTRAVAHLFPAMYYTDITVGSFLKGVGVDVLWTDVVALALYATAVWFIGFWRFRKRVAS